MPDLDALCADLAAEQEVLDGVVAERDEGSWDTPTPAEGWSVRDQISHLAFFEEQARAAATAPDAFATGLQEIAADPQGFTDGPIHAGRAKPSAEVLGWWRDARRAALSAFGGLEPGTRIPWFGPAMSPASFITARIMETWAHGQDVCDALVARREPTDRLAHIAHLGVRARPFSFQAHGLEVPEAAVRVELDLPGGGLWTAGDDGGDRISGSAHDFCLVVTQRRHLDDTSLSIEGDAARAWMSVAQAFAGPPGSGRRPGQFPKAR